MEKSKAVSELSGAFVRGPSAGRPYDSPLTVPTPDGNANVGHPAVVEAPGGSFNGYRYWMAFTPYPDATRENPCVVASNDLFTWVVPEGASNPVAPLADAVADGFVAQSDPDLEFRTSGGVTRLHMWYRPIYGSANEGIYMRTTTDGVTWSARQATNLTNPDTVGGPKKILSPSVCTEADGTLSMWLLDASVDNARVLYRVQSANGGTTWTGSTNCTYPSGFKIWHFDVNRVGGRYYAITAAEDGILRYMESADGLTWTGSSRHALDTTGTLGAADGRGFYRCTMLPVLGRRLKGRRLPLRWNVLTTVTNGDGANVWADSSWRIALYPDVDFVEGPGFPDRSTQAVYYMTQGTNYTSTPMTNSCRFGLLRIPRRVSVSEIGVNIGSAGGAGSTHRCGLYYDSGGFPIDAPIIEQVVDTSSGTGYKGATVSPAVILEAGDYWTTAVGQGTNLASISSPSVGNADIVQFAGGQTNGSGLLHNVSVAGALPTTPFPTSSAPAALVYLKCTPA